MSEFGADIRLNVKGVRHTILPGICLVGSSEHENYRTILIKDKTICHKHAAIRLDRVTKALEVMDLCSTTGVIVDQRTLDPLVWTAFGDHNRLVFGSVVVTIEVNRPITSAGQQEELFLDEDSMDVIDCSIDESLVATSRKAPTTTLQNESQRPFAAIHSSAPVRTAAQSAQDAKDRRSSLFVAETQQLDTSSRSRVADETMLKSKEDCVAKQQEATVVRQFHFEEDASFDDFFIPETQQAEEDVENPLPKNGSSDSTVGVKASVHAVSESNNTQDEEYIQLTAMNDNDDTNSNDALFNNKYVEASQNLLDSEAGALFNCGVANDAAVCKRVGSILPDRSVDSISFIEHRHNTTKDMSPIEWNESRVAENHDQLPLNGTVTKTSTAVPSGVQAIAEPDDRSVTPELNFDKPSEGKDAGRSGSTTPDLLFTNIPQPVQASVDIASKESQKNSRETPTIDFAGEQEDQESLEIPRNQEGSLPQQPKSPLAAIGAYNLETQALEVDEAEMAPDEDAYNMLTQPISKTVSTSFAMPRVPVRVSSSSVNRSCIRLQDTIDENDLLTQPLSPPRFDMASKDTRSVSVKATVHSAMDVDDLVTQPLSPPNRSRKANLEKSKSSPAINEDDLATQALSPPRCVPLPRRVAVKNVQRKNTSVSEQSIYDVQTQPMAPTPSSSCKLNRMVPYVVLTDIKHLGLVKEMEHDPYEVATQQLLENVHGNVYDLQTQPLLGTSKVAGNGSLSEENRTNVDDADCTVPLVIESQYLADKDEPNVSMFNPQINSTVRHSQIFQRPNDCVQKNLEISPSSNKENRTGDDRSGTRSESDDDTDVDDIYLASTLPIGELITSKSDSKAKTMNPKTVGKSKHADALFQVPAKVENTPKAPKRKPSDLEEFLTPEHPLLALPKPVNILSTTNDIAEMAIRNRFPNKAKLQYPFGDGSSSEDDSNDKGIFKKTNRSKEFERELEKAKEDSARIKQLQKEASAKSGPIKHSRSKRIDVKEPVMEGTTEDNRASQSSNRNKATKATKKEKEDGTARKERSVSKEKETKPSRTRSKNNARPVYKEESSSDNEDGDDKTKVPVRSGRGIDREKPKARVDQSVEYSGTNVTTESLPKTRGRKRKDVSTDKERDVQSEPKAPTRVSKRQKAANPRYKDESETTSTRRVHSKVDSSVPNGKPSSILFGDMLSGYSSSNSGSASDGSKRSTRAASNRAMIMFTRINDKLYRDSVLRAGCKIVDIPEMATILVTDRVARTCKFLCAVARGIPIVGQSYLDALKAVSNDSDVGAAVDPWQHILLDRESEKRYKFDLHKTLLKAQQAKLLSGYTVFVTSNVHPPATEIFLMLSCAGAIPLKDPGSSRAPKDGHKTFVISCPADAASWEKYREKYPTIEIFSTEWLMCSLMQYSISFKNHRLL